MGSTRYIGLLRGINVGGHKRIKMADLREMFTSLKFENVKTVLASGNVAWDAVNQDVDKMRSTIEVSIKDTFGFDVDVIVRTQKQITQLVVSNPFEDVEVTEDTRLYVAFLSTPSSTKLGIPYQTPDGDFRIIQATDSEVCSVLTLTHRRSIDAMNVLAEFGVNMTTRNWNTVLKLATL